MQVALKNTQAVQRINRMLTVSSSQLRGLNIKELAKEKKTATASTIVCGGKSLITRHSLKLHIILYRSCYKISTFSFRLNHF